MSEDRDGPRRAAERHKSTEFDETTTRSGKDIVLLARPHPRIVPIMQSWLEDLGFSPFPCATAADIPHAFAADVCGAIISLSPASPVNEGAPEVWASVQRHYPGLPVVFATIAHPDVMLKSLRASLRRRSDVPVVVRWVGDIAPTDATLGRAGLVLLLHRDDLEDRARAEAAGPVVLRHFSHQIAH